MCAWVCSGRPAVDDGGGVSGVLVHVLSDQMSEADKELSGFRNPVVRPGCEVELTNRTCLCCFHLRPKHNRHVNGHSKGLGFMITSYTFSLRRTEIKRDVIKGFYTVIQVSVSVSCFTSTSLFD